MLAREPEAQTTRTLPVRGVVRALDQATISTELVARVARLGFREGERFAKGDTLVSFDCRRHEAELAAARAQHREMEIALAGATQLAQFKAGNRQDVETAKARVERADAEIDIIRTRLDGCTIRAPYAGRIAERNINEQELSAPGRPLLAIVGEHDHEIDLIVPSTWLSWLRPGTAFKFAIDETQQAYAGKLARIGAVVDTVSQTIKVHGKLQQHDPRVLPGMSGSAQFIGEGG